MIKTLDLTEDSDRLKRVEDKVDLILNLLKSSPPVEEPEKPVDPDPDPDEPTTGDYITLEQFGGSPDLPDNWEPFRKSIEEQQKTGLDIVLKVNSNYTILGYKRINTPSPIKIYPKGSSITIGIPDYNPYNNKKEEDDYLFVLDKNPDVDIQVDILAPEQWLGVQLHNRQLFKCPSDIEQGSIIWMGNNIKQTTPSWGMGFIYSGTKGFVKVAQANINHYGSRFQDLKCNNGSKLLSVLRDCTILSDETNNIARWEIEGEFKNGKFYPDNFILDKLKGYYWNDKDIFYSLQFGTGYLYFFGSDFKGDHITIPSQLNIGDKTDKGFVSKKWYVGDNRFDYEFSDSPASTNPIPTGKTKLFICFRKNNTTQADGVKGYGHPWLTELATSEMPNKPFYNHSEMSVDWNNVHLDGYYRQSVHGNGESYGYKLDNITGFEGQFNPDKIVNEHTEPEIVEFVSRIEKLLI